MDSLNLNQFRVFEAVMRTGSMTLAARELHLTQPGISQHVRALEDSLQLKLFDRLQGRLVPTPAARDLHTRCTHALHELEEGLLAAKGQSRELKGRVTIGLPIEFGNNLIVPRLADFSRLHPLVTYRLRLGWASEINEELLKGAMDFAFVDEFAMDRRIRTEPVFDEELELCISRKFKGREPALAGPKPRAKARLAARPGSPSPAAVEFFESLDYVEYAEGEPLLRMWFAHHLGTRTARELRLDVKALVMDVQGVARFITSGAGAGVLPSYVARQVENQGEGLRRFRGRGLPVVNRISMAYLREGTPSHASSVLRKFLKESLLPRAT